MNHKHDLVLAVHPSSRGFGWILFEGPLAPFDWGVVTIAQDKNAGAVARVDQLIQKYDPRVLAFEASSDDGSRRKPRIRKLCRAIEERAMARGLRVCVYSRQQIRRAFASTGAQTREEIATIVAERIEALRPRLPQPRKIWLGEHPNMALFAAAACALTYFARRHE